MRWAVAMVARYDIRATSPTLIAEGPNAMPARRTSRVAAVGATATLLFIGYVVAAPVASAAAARYAITDLGSLGTGDLSVATAINNAGQVVGYSNPTPST